MEPEAAESQSRGDPPAEAPSPADSPKKAPRKWWSNKVPFSIWPGPGPGPEDADGAPGPGSGSEQDPSRSSHSREGSPLEHGKKSPTRAIADLVYNVVSATGRARAGSRLSVSEREVSPPAAREKDEAVPNITFTFLDAKEGSAVRNSGAEQEREVTEAVVTPECAPVPLPSDVDEEFVDARGSSSNSTSRSPSPVKGQGRESVGCPINRSPSYTTAVGEGLYARPRPRRPQQVPPPPPVPEPDWTSTDSGSNQVNSEHEHAHVQVYEELEYCKHRVDAAPELRRLERPKLVRVRSRIGRAWRAMRGWLGEERARLGGTLMRHVHAQAVGAFQPDASGGSQQLDDFDDDGDDDDDDGGNLTDEATDKVDEEGLSRRAISASTIPRLLIPRRRRDSDEMSSTSSWSRGLRRSRYMPEGQNGFEELRRYIKQGGDFCKDLSAILQERSEVEQAYAKSLAKLSSKLLKASKDAVGTVGQAWQRVGVEMECAGEIHRTFAVALSEGVVKPLKQLVEAQHRIRKSVESNVDKTSKSLSEWRQAEAKSKKTSFMCARDNEKLQDAMVEGRQATRGSSLHLHHNVHSKISDKDAAKQETKRRKAEESVKKADVEYYTFCIRAERARLEWETAVQRGSFCLQALEEERLQNLKELASMYLRHLREMGPKMVQSSDRLSEPVQNCDVAGDVQTVVTLKGTGQPTSEQLLPDFYAEHVTLGMNRDRRKQALIKVLQLIKQDLERERRSKQGVENLARALQQTPNFGAEDSQQNVTEKIHHMRSMLTYLEAARYKVQSALAELEGKTRLSHPLASHIVVHRDRQGLQQSILKVPPWVQKDSLDHVGGESPDWMDRGAADGNSVQPDSDFDEFSSQGSEKDYNGSLIISECASNTQASNNPSVGTCRALYQYAANLYDELNLNPGDVINIHDKQDDGWWLGELNGTIGIFPATYVEEIK